MKFSMILIRAAAIALSLMSLHCGSSDSGDGGGLENEFSLLFDGEDDYGSAGDIDITLDSNIDQCSISLWFKPEASPADGAMMLQLNPELEGGVNAMQISLYWDAVDRVGLHLTPDFEAVEGARLFADLEDAEGWNHVLVTFDANASSNNVRLYLNGVEVASGDQGAAMEAVGNIQFARQGTGINHFNGYLDEAAIWASALSAEEAVSVYRTGVPGNLLIDYGTYSSSASLRSLWRMGDENFATEANVSDRVGGNNFTIVNGGSFENDRP